MFHVDNFPSFKIFPYNKPLTKNEPMTLIVGAKCTDGVVLVADKKIIKINEIDSISFEYKRKLHGELRHVIFGLSGSTETFEFFVDEIKERVNQGDVKLRNVTNVISDKVLEINKKRDFNRKLFFNLLVAVQYPNNKTLLTYIDGYGGKSQIDKYRSIGIGSIFAEPFLKNIWNPNLKMSKIASVGWFIIKYIEDYQLHSSVGIGVNYPQIWFIPDNETNTKGEKVDYEVNPETRPKEFKEIKNDVNKNFKLYHKQLQKLFH
jgi:20S proteasome alpha/beta subunit